MGLFSKGDGFDDKDYKAWRVHGAVNNVLGSDRLDNVFHDLAPDFDAYLQKAADGDDNLKKFGKNISYASYYGLLNDKYQELEIKYDTMKKQYDALKASLEHSTNETVFIH
jgi:hypothetical protein